MRAAVAAAANAPLALSNRDVPEPGAGEVPVKVTACGVCFSDLNLLQGHYPFARFPVVPGHEITGVVTAAGEGVTWPEVGTAVGAQFLYDSCGHCDYCVRGDQILCPSKRITGVVTDGGYAEYAVLKAGATTQRDQSSFLAAFNAGTAAPSRFPLGRAAGGWVRDLGGHHHACPNLWGGRP
ncbi:alcohol dehydrogenase catalytic domain-containing protein [Streptomyces flaveolus]|uniref:alcohol dehydrogenase n=2 Tax=Streptomyces TaxID=1883 RepID=A0ABV3AKK9_9ACTN